MTHTLFNEFSILILLTFVMGFIAFKLRQPLILAYIMAGVIAGPYSLGIISAQSGIDVLASFGVTLLLFIVGLKLDMNTIKSFGAVVLRLGVMQILITAALGFVLATTMGIDRIAALFIAFTLAFSSTIIIIKALSDKNDIDALFGRIAVGILIVQDLVVVVAIIVLSSLNISHVAPNHMIWEISMLILKGLGSLGLVVLLTKYVVPSLAASVANSRELLILFALAWAVILSAGAESLGFGTEIGGFLAGVSLASTHYRESIASRLDTLRNLLLVFFFINLGAALQFDTLSNEMIPALVLSLFVLIIKPMIVMVLMGLARFRKRTSFMTAMTMGQVSEFSLILAALGHSLGYIDEKVVGLIIVISLISIGISTYVIANASVIYNRLAPLLDIFERDARCLEDRYNHQNLTPIDVIIYGFGRHGQTLAEMLEEKGLKTMGVDFDPRRMSLLPGEVTPIRYGDAEDAEFIKNLPLDQAKWVVSTIPHYDANHILVASLRERNYHGKIALSVYHEHDLEPARKLHVDMVFVPYRDAALSAAEQIAGTI